MRAIFEALGYYVTWDQESQAVFANNIYTDNFIIVDLKIDSICTYIFSEYDWDNKDFIKNHTKLLDHAPVIIDGRTLVPVRAISEAGGCDVNWDNSTRSVYIKSTVPIVNNANNNLFNNSIYSSSSALLNNKLGKVYVSNIKFPLHLYGQDSKRTYLGKLTTNKYDIDSISNVYGSKYSQTSIFNRYSDFGSNYSQYSVFNKYASSLPKIVDDNGTFVAYLTTSTTEIRGATYEQLMQFLNNNKQ